jgi:hypothetical protein
MKNYVLIIAFLLSCSSGKEKLQFYPESGPVVNWTHFEGKVPLDQSRSLVIELSLLPSANPAEGQYQLYESIDDGASSQSISELTGSYSAFQDDGRIIVRLHNSALGDVVKRNYYVKNEKGDLRYREENLRSVDLSLLRLDDDTFSVLATTSLPLSENPNDYVYRRSSSYFTIEGYFRHTGDSADFFEMNTQRRWAITKMGAYTGAIRQYHELVEKKFQPVYLKGVGFSINRPDENGNRVEALVIKKLLQMSSVSDE